MQETLSYEGRLEGMDIAPLFVLNVREPEKSSFVQNLAKILDGKQIKDIGAMAEQLEDNKSAQAIVVYDAAKTVVCGALQQNSDPSAALEEWSEQMLRHLQPLLYRNRGRIALIESSALAERPAEMLKKASQYFGRDLVVTELTATTVARDTILQLIANNILEGAENAKSVDGKLEAQALPYNQPDATNLANHAVKDYTEMTHALSDAQSREVEVSREIRNLYSLIQQQAQELENSARNMARRENQAELQQVHISFLQRELEAQQDAFAMQKADQQEKISRGVTVKKLRGALEKMEAERERLYTLLSEKDISLETKKREINELRTSTSWRLTAPLRWLKTTFSRSL